MSDTREIKRPVTVADDQGIPKQFGKGSMPEGTSNGVIERLERAGAFGDRPLTSTGGTGAVEVSGFNPLTSTATAEAIGEAEGTTDKPVRFGDGTDHSAGTDAAADLDGMTKAELIEHANGKGITVDASKSKADILAAIKAA